MKVTVRNDNVERALAIFRKKCGEVLLEVRKREFYEKPTNRRTRLKNLAKIRERKRQEGNTVTKA
jgi:ribosomal protein S21